MMALDMELLKNPSSIMATNRGVASMLTCSSGFSSRMRLEYTPEFTVVLVAMTPTLPFLIFVATSDTVGSMTLNRAVSPAMARMDSNATADAVLHAMTTALQSFFRRNSNISEAYSLMAAGDFSPYGRWAVSPK